MKVKNANAKRKATAIGLTAVMSLSVIGAGISTVSAATAGSDMVGSVASDAGIAAAHCAVDKLIEVACDSTPAMKILGAAGIGVLDSLFGSVFDTGMKLEDVDDHITRSTDEIKNDIANMASDMNTFHTEEMTAFGNLSDLVSRVGIQVSLSGFDSQSNTSEACHTHFNNLIQKTYSDQISSTFASGETQEETKKLEDYKVIDKKTCEAFESITEECPFIIDNYYNMWNYLQQNKNTYNSIARLQARYCDENLDNLNTTGNGVCNEDRLSQIVSFDTVENQLKGYQSEMVLYYFDCLQYAQMKYDIKNYMNYQKYKNSPDELEEAFCDNTSRFQKDADTYNEMLKNVQESYQDAIIQYYHDKKADFTISVNNHTYNFSTDDPMRGWMALDTFSSFHQGPVSDNTDMTMTLNGNWAAKDSNLGFYIDSRYKTMTARIPQCESDEAYLIIPQPNWVARKATTFTLNLNGYSIINPYTDKPVFGCAPNTYAPLKIFINGSGTIDNATFMLSGAKAGCLELKIDSVTLRQRGDLYMLDGRGPGKAILLSCNGTYENDGVYFNTGTYGSNVFSYALNHCNINHV